MFVERRYHNIPPELTPYVKQYWKKKYDIVEEIADTYLEDDTYILRGYTSNPCFAKEWEKQEKQKYNDAANMVEKQEQEYYGIF